MSGTSCTNVAASSNRSSRSTASLRSNRSNPELRQNFTPKNQFARDRRRYLYWLFEAKTRYGLCVLDYIATSNHVHLLVKDTGGDVIARSMQLVAGRTRGSWFEVQGSTVQG
jgi:hypothetical protein